MPPHTTDQTQPPTSPAQLASALLDSFQRMTSSARLLLIGCFQCQFLKAGCLRRQEEHDGAWFDCDKLQTEHPYCYVNPVALADATPDTALCHPPPCQSPPRAANPVTPIKASPQRSPGSALAPRGLSMQPRDPLPKRHKTSHVNGDLASRSEEQHEQGSGTVDPPFKDSVGLKDGVALYTRGHDGRTSLVESFAAKLEADLRRLEYDRQRAEGEVVALAPSGDESDWLTEYLGSKGRGPDFFLEAPSNSPYDELEDPPRLRPDVWKPSELENVFECYNMAAFYSYGATCQVTEKFSSRVRGEKFEEVFPVSSHCNNNNNNNSTSTSISIGSSSSSSSSNNNNNSKVHTAKDLDSAAASTVVDKNKTVTDSVPRAAGQGLPRECSEDQLRQIIEECVFAETVTEVDDKCFLGDKGGSRNCQSMINFGGKSFNKLLIFNLVKSTMCECAGQYPRSLTLCSTYPVHLVQNKVMNVMLDEDKSEENLCGLQVFHAPSLSPQRERQAARRLVMGVAAAEVKAEDQQWQNFKKEEQEMKETIADEVLHDLIGDTADVFKLLLAKKLSLSHEPEGDKG